MKLFYGLLFFLSCYTAIGQDLPSNLTHAPEKIEDFKLYPNPAYNGTVYLVSKTNAPKVVEVYDVFGEMVLKDRIKGKTLDISTLAPGIYVLRVTEGNNTITRKLVVK